MNSGSGHENQKIMREEYDLKKLKVKRRGLLPELKDEKGEQTKVKITISFQVKQVLLAIERLEVHHGS